MTSPNLIAQTLLDVKAVTLSPNDPYTWASGIKSPIYCDNRLNISNIRGRNTIIEGYIQLIKDKFPKTELIAGVATSGIPWAAIIADRLNLPMVYVRASAKEHGKQNSIEGYVDGLENKHTVVIEDLISTGGSVLAAVQNLKDNRFKVEGVAAIFTYQMKKGYNAFKEAGTTYETLSNWTSLVEVAVNTNYISKDDITILETFHKQFE